MISLAACTLVADGIHYMTMIELCRHVYDGTGYALIILACIGWNFVKEMAYHRFCPGEISSFKLIRLQDDSNVRMVFYFQYIMIQLTTCFTLMKLDMLEIQQSFTLSKWLLNQIEFTIVFVIFYDLVWFGIFHSLSHVSINSWSNNIFRKEHKIHHRVVEDTNGLNFMAWSFADASLESTPTFVLSFLVFRWITGMPIKIPAMYLVSMVCGNFMVHSANPYQGSFLNIAADVFAVNVAHHIHHFNAEANVLNFPWHQISPFGYQEDVQLYNKRLMGGKASFRPELKVLIHTVLLITVSFACFDGVY